ncbi:hypothetical protein [Glaciihabitans sp. GrIS 2.15]|uniref:hypothetical protein n=1 Tax=Glaciihabitans sp. GrIS 2.15 TaxID=3071710 RepID=UPI002DFA3836|nr:hypothetical protein [Glaciihabitans sp. GrIS 2.15]
MSGISNGGASNYTSDSAADVDWDPYGEIQDDIADEFLGLTGEELRSGGNDEPAITLAQVRVADQRVSATGVLGLLPAWRLEDGGPKGPGGQPARIDDRLTLIALLLLATEKRPMWMTNVTNIFAYRLGPDAREYLGLTRDGIDYLDEAAMHNLYNACRNAFQRLLEPMDPYVQPRFLQGFDQRRCLLEEHDKNRARRCKARLDWFSNAFLQMSFMMQSREIRRADRKVNISFDQTFIAPVSVNSFTKARDEETLQLATELDLLERPTTRDERKSRNKKLKDRLVGEVFAGLYIMRPDKRDEAPGAKSGEMKWGWAANVAIRVTNNSNEKTPFPLLIMALTFSLPGRDVSAEAVSLMKSIVGRGHEPGYAAADNDYWAHADIEKLHLQSIDTGFRPLTRYRVDTLGHKGGYAGAKQVEGNHYCPGMPTNLINATLDFNAGTETEETYRLRISQRKQYALRNKERPAADNSVKKMCPAFGPGATITCIFRDVHNKSSKKAKVAVQPKYRPSEKLEICSKTSVKFPAHAYIKFEQDKDYGTVEHEELLTSARNSAEGTFGQLKDNGFEGLSSASRRKVRGYAAAQVFVTLLLVAFNIRTISSFMKKLAWGTPKKKRNFSIAYRPYVDKRRIEREERRKVYLQSLDDPGPNSLDTT